MTCRWMAYDSQQDPIDGDRRDVPVETMSAAQAHTYESRVQSRSFSAMLGRSEVKSALPNDSGPSYSGPSFAGPSYDEEATSRIAWCAAPGRWVWRLVLRTDSLLVDTLRSMLMLDPKPDRFRARN